MKKPPKGPNLPPRPLPGGSVGAKPPPRSSVPPRPSNAPPPRAPVTPAPQLTPTGPKPGSSAQPPPRQPAAAGGGEAPDPGTVKEQLTIAGTTLDCVRSSLANEEGPVTTQSTSWLCRQVPGFLVRSQMRIAGQVETEDGPAPIRSSSRTELIGYRGRVVNTAANGEPEHAWADFAPGAWVKLKTTTEEIVEGEPVASTTETLQKLLSVSEEGVEVELTLSGEEGEIHKEVLQLTLDDAAEGEAPAEPSGQTPPS